MTLNKLNTQNMSIIVERFFILETIMMRYLILHIGLFIKKTATKVSMRVRRNVNISVCQILLFLNGT